MTSPEDLVSFGEIIADLEFAKRDLKKKLDEANEATEKYKTALEDGRGHDQPCHICGETTNSFAGNPGMWPIPICTKDDPGVVKWHHSGCVQKKLAGGEEAIKSAESYRRALQWCMSAAGNPDPAEGCRLIAGLDLSSLSEHPTPLPPVDSKYGRLRLELVPERTMSDDLGEWTKPAEVRVLGSENGEERVFFGASDTPSGGDYFPPKLLQKLVDSHNLVCEFGSSIPQEGLAERIHRATSVWFRDLVLELQGSGDEEACPPLSEIQVGLDALDLSILHILQPKSTE